VDFLVGCLFWFVWFFVFWGFFEVEGGRKEGKEKEREDLHTHPLATQLGRFLEAYIHLSNLIDSIQPKENKNRGS